MFKIALLNSLKWVDTANINNSFDGDFAINQLLSYQDPKCYFQKWQKSDTIRQQVLSDYAPTALLLREFNTNKIVSSIDWQPQPTMIIGQTFKVYELSFILNFNEGKYYAEFSYDDSTIVHRMVSEPFHIKTKWDNTVLLKYKNSENDKDVIFDTGIEFQFRVEGAVRYNGPGNKRNVYNDQDINPTLLSATSYRRFKLFIGYKYGVPFWVQDKINTIITVNQVSYNNVFYQTPAEAEWEDEKNDANDFIGASIEVYPTDNNFSKYTTTPVNEDNEFTPMQKVLPYTGISADFGIAGKFKYRSLLEHICIIKRTAPEFVLKVGTTNGGEEIGQFTVDDFENTFTIEHLFSGTATVYLSGIDGADIDLDVIYKQLDEKPVPITPVDGVGTKEGKGTTKVYTEMEAGDLAIHWDTNTGLGRANTAWDGWAWMDGRNGMPDWTKRVPLMLDESDPNWDLTKLGTEIGSDKITITKANLPAEGLNIFAGSVGGSGGDIPGANDSVARARSVGSQNLNYEIVKGSVGATLGKTSNMGSGVAIDHVTNGIISIWVGKKID